MQPYLSVNVMLDRLDETIVAISSAPGYGPVGIVRLSGPDAIGIADRMAIIDGGASLATTKPSTRVSGDVQLDDDLRLPASFYLFREPRSYTRQDMIEILTIGSPAALDLVRERAMDLGAVAAEPGEFTARAFLNGAMDLSQAEAVAAVIRARNDTQLRASRRMMDGRLSADIATARNELAELVALVEADIDFAEEPIDFITPGQLSERLRTINTRVRGIAATSQSAERLDVLPHILLFGAPNAGKSSLMNRLSGTSRAICNAAAGTTRDILSAPVRLRRCEAILLDTAGVDRSNDEIIARARANVLSEAERVDLVCLVVDLTQPESVEPLCSRVRTLNVPSIVIAANKSDLLSQDEMERRCLVLADQALGPMIPVSALTGAGVDRLRDALADALGGTETTTSGDSLMLTRRQERAVVEALEAIGRAVVLSETVSETIDCADVLAVELREALDTLGTVCGEVTTEDLLGRVFANFCIGK